MKGTKVLLLIGAGLAATGCRTLSASVDRVEKIGNAAVGTVGILKEPINDANDLWLNTLGGKDAPPAPAVEPVK